MSGKGVLLSTPKDDEDEDNEEPERHAIEKGDFAFIPAWTEHQVVNESDQEDLHWVITRSGPQPVQVNLKGWYVGFLHIFFPISPRPFSACVPHHLCEVLSQGLRGRPAPFFILKFCSPV